MVALLISALALTMLAGAIATAANLITKSETMMNDYYAGINLLGNPITSGLSISLEDTKLVGGTTSALNASYALNKAFSSKPVITYKYDEETGT